MSSSDDLGNRMKLFERLGSDQRLMPLLPVIVRIDGRSFSSFTKGMDRPFDQRMSNLMIGTTIRLVKETNAVIGYTQSDEISLILYSDRVDTQLYFDGRHSKLTSVIASLATVYFNDLLNKFSDSEFVSKYSPKLPVFDCRVFSVPTKVEAVNYLLWREWDATKNSITMAAREFFVHAQLEGKTGSQKQEMLHERGVNWNDYPSHFKRGTYVQRRLYSHSFTAQDLAALPPKHHARPGHAHSLTEVTVDRFKCCVLGMQPLTRVTNKLEVVFNGAIPQQIIPVLGETP